MSPARWIAAARLALAAVLLTRPRLVLTAALVPRERGSARARGVVKLLGLRTLVQSLVELARPTRPVLTGGAVVDALHALSFLGFAAARPDPRWRRAVLLNVATATLFSVATITTARRTPNPAADLAPDLALDLASIEQAGTS